jgi:hypothetical protein
VAAPPDAPPWRLALALDGRPVTVLGGPFALCPDGAFGVCLAAEAPNAARADVLVPAPDFGLPEAAALRAAVAEALAALRADPSRPLFVGCRAGIGRTGLFLACLARAAGVPGDPVAYVRARYHPAAAETPAQVAMAHGFVPG